LLLAVAAAFVLVVGLGQVTPAIGHRDGGDQLSEDCDSHNYLDDHQDGDHHGDGGGDDACEGGATTITTAPAAPSGSTPTAPSSASVSIPGRSFSPASVTIAAGGTVRWTNSDRDSHTVTADSGSFDSGILAAGGTFSHTFSAAGTFAYHCEIHPDMRGTVTVKGTGGTAGSGAAPAPPATNTAGSRPSASGSAPVRAGSVDRPVSMIDLAFSPRSLSAVVGDSVTWTNRGSAVHTATAENGSFDSGIVKPGGSWRFALAKAGTFRYHCTVHPNMVGTITVAAAGSPAPPVAPAAKSGGTAGPSGGVSGAPAASAARASVAIRDFEFVPPRVTVAKGTTVTWTNRGNAPHTATAVDRSFDSGMLQPGGRFSRRFDTLGTFQYLCLVHPSMRGTVVVTKAAARGAASAGDPAGGKGGTATGAGPGVGGATATTLGTESAASRLSPTLVAALLVAVAGSAGLLVTAVAVVVATRKLLRS
jgi:plastocyanin